MSDLTLVFDKGNNSKGNLTEAAGTGLHFAGWLVPTHHPQLLAISCQHMRRLDQTQLRPEWAYRTEQKVFGVSRAVLVVFNRPLIRAQVKTLRREVNKRCRKVKVLHVALQRSAQRTRARSPRSRAPASAWRRS